MRLRNSNCLRRIQADGDGRLQAKFWNPLQHPWSVRSRYRSAGKRRYGRCDKAANFPFETQLRIESSTPPASSAPGLSGKEGRRRARERQGRVCRVGCRDYEPRNIAADVITGQYLEGWSELCRRRGGILPRRAFGNLLQRPLAGARLFHFLPHCVKVVAGRDDREEQEQKAAEGYRELENRFGATALPQPEVNPRANQQQPEQVEK